MDDLILLFTKFWRCAKVITFAQRAIYIRSMRPHTISHSMRAGAGCRLVLDQCRIGAEHVLVGPPSSAEHKQSGRQELSGGSDQGHHSRWPEIYAASVG